MIDSQLHFKPTDISSLSVHMNRPGYLWAYVPGRCKKPGSRIFIHRLVMENHIGRYLDRSEVVHHIDGNPLNNDISNLELLTGQAEHSFRHRIIPKRVCQNQLCGKEFAVTERVINDRYTKPGQRKYCSLECSIQAKKSKLRESRKLNKGRRVVMPSREELRRLVWSEPSEQVAKRFGVSGRMVGKWCEKLGVDKPPRGYWAKMIAGKADAAP